LALRHLKYLFTTPYGDCIKVKDGKPFH